MTLDRYARARRRDADRYRAALDSASIDSDVLENVTPIITKRRDEIA